MVWTNSYSWIGRRQCCLQKSCLWSQLVKCCKQQLSPILKLSTVLVRLTMMQGGKSSRKGRKCLPFLSSQAKTAILQTWTFSTDVAGGFSKISDQSASCSSYHDLSDLTAQFFSKLNDLFRHWCWCSCYGKNQEMKVATLASTLTR